MGNARTLAQAYRHFGEVDAAGTSPLYERVALALSTSDAAQRAIEAVPGRQPHPALVLAALHDLALAGQAPALAAAYAAADGDAAARAAIATLAEMADAVVAVAGRRPLVADETQRCVVLHPAVAEAAARTGARAVGLIDVGGTSGLNLHIDRVGVTYDDGRTVGDPTSPVRLTAAVKGEQPIPLRDLPPVVARIGVDPDPLDVTDAADVRWWRACVWPDQPARAARLEAELAVAAADPPVLLRDDVLDALPEAVTRVPADALPVVITTWALSSRTLEDRLRFLRRLDEAALDRTVAWVSVEGVGVAPAVPTLGDRPASGHSIVGVAVVEQSALRTEVVGRCWSRGRWLSWLAGA